MNAVYSLLLKLGIRDLKTLRFVLRLFALLVSVIGAFVASMLMEMNEFRWAAFVFVPVLLTAILDFVMVDLIADKSFPIEIAQKLMLMEKQLGNDAIQKISDRLQLAIEQFPACDQARVSATVHVLTELPTTSDLQVPEGLLQLTDYVGPDGGKKGRVTPINQGVIGRCARTRSKEHVDFADAAEYMDRMVRDFGFSIGQTEQHTKEGRSYLAYPLKSGERLIGVLYFFTTEPQVFPAVARNDVLDDVSREVVNYMSLADLV